MTSRDQVDDLARGLRGLSDLAKRDLRAFWARISHSSPQRIEAALREYMPPLIAAYGTQAAAYAAAWYEALRAEWATGDTWRVTMADGMPSSGVVQRVESACRHLHTSDPGAALTALLYSSDKFVKKAGRDTIYRAARQDPTRPRFARVPTGATTCTFCLMLASRGAVYADAEKAGDLNKYHGECDCQAVPIGPGTALPAGYDPDVYLEQWRDAT